MREFFLKNIGTIFSLSVMILSGVLFGFSLGSAVFLSETIVVSVIVGAVFFASALSALNNFTGYQFNDEVAALRQENDVLRYRDSQGDMIRSEIALYRKRFNARQQMLDKKLCEKKDVIQKDIFAAFDKGDSRGILEYLLKNPGKYLVFLELENKNEKFSTFCFSNDEFKILLERFAITGNKIGFIKLLCCEKYFSMACDVLKNSSDILDYFVELVEGFNADMVDKKYESSISLEILNPFEFPIASIRSTSGKSFEYSSAEIFPLIEQNTGKLSHPTTGEEISVFDIEITGDNNYLDCGSNGLENEIRFCHFISQEAEQTIKLLLELDRKGLAEKFVENAQSFISHSERKKLNLVETTNAQTEEELESIEYSNLEKIENAEKAKAEKLKSILEGRHNEVLDSSTIDLISAESALHQRAGFGIQS